MARTKSPKPVDRYVAARIRLQRRALGISQHKLAEMIGVSIQQVRKYEWGANRVSASGYNRSRSLGRLHPRSFSMEQRSSAVGRRCRLASWSLFLRRRAWHCRKLLQKSAIAPCVAFSSVWLSESPDASL